MEMDLLDYITILGPVIYFYVPSNCIYCCQVSHFDSIIEKKFVHVTKPYTLSCLLKLSFFTTRGLQNASKD